MTQALIDFINENEDLIDNNEWDELYAKANSTIPSHIGALTLILLDADIHPEYHVSKLPSKFLEGTDIVSFDIPDNITTIGGFAFYNCDNLTDIVIPNSVTSINIYAFTSCDNLTNVSIGNSLTNIGSWAFLGCSNLTNITIPGNVTSIDSSAFRDCTNLSHVVIDHGVTTISYSAFEGCTKLTHVILPDSITHLAIDAFKNCGDALVIEYSGTKTQFKQLAKESFRGTYYVCHCIDGDIIKKKR